MTPMLEPLQENAKWRPELHPRDRLGRFRDVFKSILKLGTGQWMDLDKIVGDAPNIEKAYVFKTKDGWEVRGSTKTGTYGIKITPADLAGNEHEFEDRLESLNETDPFADKTKCGCGCGAPAKSTYLPGHDARHKGNLVKAAQAGDTNAQATLDAKGWTKFLDKAKPLGPQATTPDANHNWEPEGTGTGALPAEVAGIPEPPKPYFAPDAADYEAYQAESTPKDEPELDEQIDDLESQLDPADYEDYQDLEPDEYIQYLKDAIKFKTEGDPDEAYLKSKNDPAVASGNAGIPADMLYNDPDLAKPWQVDEPADMPDLDDPNEVIEDWLKKQEDAEKAVGYDADAPIEEPELENQIDELESQLDVNDLPDPAAYEPNDYIQLLKDAILNMKEDEAVGKYDPDGGLVSDKVAAEAADVDDEYADVDPYPDLPTCNCGCGGAKSATARYLPGHDSRHKSALVKAAKAGDKRAYKTLQVKGWLKFLDKSKDTGPKTPKTPGAKKEKVDYTYDPSRVPAGLPLSEDVYPNFRLLDPGPGTQEEQVERLTERRDAVTSLVDRQMLNETLFRIRGGHQEGSSKAALVTKDSKALRVYGVYRWLEERGWPGLTRELFKADGSIRWSELNGVYKTDLQKLMRSKAGRAEIEALALKDFKEFMDSDLTPSQALQKRFREQMERIANWETDYLPVSPSGVEAVPTLLPRAQEAMEKYLRQKNGGLGEDDELLSWKIWVNQKTREIAELKKDPEAFLAALETWRPLVPNPMYERALNNYPGYSADIKAMISVGIFHHRPTFREWYDTHGKRLLDAPISAPGGGDRGWGIESLTPGNSIVESFRALAVDRLLVDEGDEETLLSTASMHDVSFDDQVIDADWEDELFRYDTPDRGRAMFLKDDPFEDHHLMVHALTLEPRVGGKSQSKKYKDVAIDSSSQLRPGDIIYNSKGEPARVTSISSDITTTPVGELGMSAGYAAVLSPLGEPDYIYKEIVPVGPMRRLATRPVPVNPGASTRVYSGAILRFDLDAMGLDDSMQVEWFEGNGSTKLDSAPIIGGHSYRATSVAYLDDENRPGFKSFEVDLVDNDGTPYFTKISFDPNEYPNEEESWLAVREPQMLTEYAEATQQDDPDLLIKGRVHKDKAGDIATKLIDLGAEEKIGTWDRKGSPDYASWAKGKIGIASNEATSLQLVPEEGKIVEFIPDDSTINATNAAAPEARKAGREFLAGIKNEDLLEYQMTVPVYHYETTTSPYNVQVARVIVDPKDDYRILAVLSASETNVWYDGAYQVGNIPGKKVDWDQAQLNTALEKIAKENGAFYSAGGYGGNVGSKTGELFFRRKRTENNVLVPASDVRPEDIFNTPQDELEAVMQEKLKAVGLDFQDTKVAPRNITYQKTAKYGGSNFGSFEKFGMQLLGIAGKKDAPANINSNGFKKNVHSERRRFRMHGFKAAEAVAWLKDNLGIKPEEKVPFKQIYRSDRKMGHPALLHDDYADGSIKPELGNKGVVHRSTGGSAALVSIIETGAIVSISEKGERRRINDGNGRFKGHKQGQSELGDVGSGLDSHVFMNLGHGITYASNADITFVFRTETAMRKGSLITNTDFGGGGDRNARYRTYMKGQGADFDEGASPAQVADPKRMKSMVDGQNELNVLNEAPMEDLGALIIGPHYKNDSNVQKAIEKLRAINPDVEVIYSDVHMQRDAARTWLDGHNKATGFTRDGTASAVKAKKLMQAHTLPDGTRVMVPVKAIWEWLNDGAIDHIQSPSVKEFAAMPVYNDIIRDGHVEFTTSINKNNGLVRFESDMDMPSWYAAGSNLMAVLEWGIPADLVAKADKGLIPFTKEANS